MQHPDGGKVQSMQHDISGIDDLHDVSALLVPTQQLRSPPTEVAKQPETNQVGNVKTPLTSANTHLSSRSGAKTPRAKRKREEESPMETAFVNMANTYIESEKTTASNSIISSRVAMAKSASELIFSVIADKNVDRVSAIELYRECVDRAINTYATSKDADEV